MSSQEQPPAQRTRVRIAVLTFRRPGDLADVLPLLVAEADRAARLGWSVDVLVVDNDPDASARNTVAGFAAEASVPVLYVHEPEPGIAVARNRALDESDEVDVLVFIDDDERPVEGWLSLLLGTYSQYDCCVVGPVVSTFDSEPDAWIVEGRFFVRRRMPTGTPVSVAATNNLLIPMRDVAAHGLRFDPNLGLTGGSDTLFTRQLHKAGVRLLWNDEAIVYDVVPADRATRRWVLRRSLRSGTSWSVTSQLVADTRAERVVSGLRDAGSGLLRVAGGAARLIAGSLLRRPALQAAGARNLARGAGLVAGVFGYHYREYKRT